MLIRLVTGLLALTTSAHVAADEIKLRCEGTLKLNVMGKDKPTEVATRYYIFDAEKRKFWLLIEGERKDCVSNCQLSISEHEIVRTFNGESSQSGLTAVTRIDRLSGNLTETWDMYIKEEQAHRTQAHRRLDAKCEKVEFEDRRF